MSRSIETKLPGHASVLQDRKRSIEALSSNDYSKYGTTMGILTTVGSSVVFCGCLCTGWPNWAWAAQARGWCVAIIITKDSSWVKTIQKCFTNTCVLTFVSGFSLGEDFAKIKICDKV